MNYFQETMQNPYIFWIVIALSGLLVALLIWKILGVKSDRFSYEAITDVIDLHLYIDSSYGWEKHIRKAINEQLKKVRLLEQENVVVYIHVYVKGHNREIYNTVDNNKFPKIAKTLYPESISRSQSIFASINSMNKNIPAQGDNLETRFSKAKIWHRAIVLCGTGYEAEASKIENDVKLLDVFTEFATLNASMLFYTISSQDAGLWETNAKVPNLFSIHPPVNKATLTFNIENIFKTVLSL